MKFVEGKRKPTLVSIEEKCVLELTWHNVSDVRENNRETNNPYKPWRN